MNTLRTQLVAASTLVVTTLAAQAGLGGLSDYEYDPPAPGTYTLPVVKRAADGEVLDSRERPLHLRELTQGRITVMSFIYTRCAAAKACPYATGVLAQLHRLSAEDPALAKELRLISMSFDPENDTPRRMAAYSAWAGGREAAAEWRFLTTRSRAELQPILDAYGQAVDKKRNPNDPTGPLNHTLRVYLIDRQGNIRNIYSSGTLDPRLVLVDVKTLMMEKAPSKAAPLSSAQPASRPGQVCTVGARQKVTWESGDFGQVAKFNMPTAGEFMARIELRPGTKPLDAACGTGNLAVIAPDAGASLPDWGVCYGGGRRASGHSGRRAYHSLFCSLPSTVV